MAPKRPPPIFANAPAPATPTLPPFPSTEARAFLPTSLSLFHEVTFLSSTMGTVGPGPRHPFVVQGHDGSERSEGSTRRAFDEAYKAPPRPGSLPPSPPFVCLTWYFSSLRVRCSLPSSRCSHVILSWHTEGSCSLDIPFDPMDAESGNPRLMPPTALTESEAVGGVASIGELVERHGTGCEDR